MDLPFDVVATCGRAGIFLIVLWGAGGVGRLLCARACLSTYGWRGTVAQQVIGVLAYATMFGLLAEAHARHELAVILLSASGVVGLVVQLWTCLRGDGRRQLLLVLGLTGAFVAAGAVRVNPNAADPQIYAYTASLAFRETWSSTGLMQVPGLREFLAENLMSRASSVALLWPLSLPGWGVSTGLVGQVAIWLMLSVFLLVVDILPARVSLVVRSVVAVGALGVFDEVAVLTGGQINQACALATVVSTVWIGRHIDARFVQVLALVLTAALVFGGYPEFVLALPLYILAMELVRSASWRQMCVDVLGVGIGAGAVQLTTQLANAQWLMRQIDAVPAWWPLDNAPHDLLELWVAIALQRSVPWYALALAAGGLFAWSRRRPFGVSAPEFLPLSVRVNWYMSVLLALLAIWSIVVLRAPNVNYAAFKIGGWIGPGLFMVMWLLVERSRAPVGRAGALLLIALAAFRTSAVVIDAPPKLLLYASRHASSPWHVEQGTRAQDCLLVVSSAEPTVLMQALAESGAPTRGCGVVAAPPPESLVAL